MSQIQFNQVFAQRKDMNINVSNVTKRSNDSITHDNLTSNFNFRPKLNLISNSSAGPGFGSQPSTLLANKVTGDFNGDGKDDLAIKVPYEDVGSIRDAGAVEVVYGYSQGLNPKLGDQFLTQSSLTNNPSFDNVNDLFGYSLAAGDFNGDGLDDLAIGVPEDLIGQIRPGAVYVVFGTALGLAGDDLPIHIFLQGSDGVDDVQENFDAFGSSLSSGDFNGDGKDDLAIGAVREEVGLTEAAGGVEVIYGSSSGLSATTTRADQFWTQDSTDIDDDAEAGDGFGYSLSSGDFNGDGKDDLAIGVSGENLGLVENAGAVEVIHGTATGLSATSPIADQFWTQDSPDVENEPNMWEYFGQTLSSGDFNGDGKDDLAIGVPDEGPASNDNAGAVEVIHGTSTGLSATSPIADQFWTQDSTDIDAGTGLYFGISLSSGDFNGDAKDDLAIGVPYADIGSVASAGGVEVIHGTSTGLSATSPIADQYWTQDSTDVDDVAEFHFGSSLSSGDFNGDGRDDLAIAVPNEDVGSIRDAGGVEVLYSSGGSLGGVFPSYKLSATFPTPDQFFTQNSKFVKDVSEVEDQFGGEVPD